MARASDLLALTKPRIILLLSITCLAGALAAAGGDAALLAIRLPAVLLGTLGLMLSAAGANSLNMWFDRDIDPLMVRTRNRPLPGGRVSPRGVLAYGLALVGAGVAVAAVAHPLCGLISLCGALFYVLVYTMWLKRRTVQNIVIGGAAGAFPPLIGWAAVQGGLDHPLPWLMFAVIFLWTPPHFWALALLANADYTRAGVPMYPVVHGEAATRRAVVGYLAVLVALTLLGGLAVPGLGALYLATAAALGGWWLAAALRLLKAPPTAESPVAARVVFTRSLTYLALLFLAMVADCWL